MGIIVLGVGLGGLIWGSDMNIPSSAALLLTGGTIVVFGSLYHTLNHALTKSLMFLSFGNVMERYQNIDIKGLMQVLPLTSSILVIGGLTLVGMPPFAIFLSEFVIVYGAIRGNGLVNQAFNPQFSGFGTWLIFIAIGLFVSSTLLIFFGLIPHLAKVVLDKPTQNLRMEKEGWFELLLIISLLVFVIGFGFGLFSTLSKLILASAQIVLFGQ
jgi:hydrogenase-4 component F